MRRPQADMRASDVFNRATSAAICSRDNSAPRGPGGGAASRSKHSRRSAGMTASRTPSPEVAQAVSISGRQTNAGRYLALQRIDPSLQLRGLGRGVGRALLIIQAGDLRRLQLPGIGVGAGALGRGVTKMISQTPAAERPNGGSDGNGDGKGLEPERAASEPERRGDQASLPATASAKVLNTRPVVGSGPAAGQNTSCRPDLRKRATLTLFD